MKAPFSRAVAVACGLAASLTLAPDARAQVVTSPVERLDFDRPEAWALKYFTSTTLMTGLDVPEAIGAGALTIALELGWIPSLTTNQQRIGFNGTKQEELNKAPMFARPRVTLGLPGRLSLTLGGVPPVKAFGVTPRLFMVAVGRPIVTSDAWNLGARVSGQVGSAKSSFTCPEGVLSYPLGDPGNPFGCQATSSDVAKLRFVSGELTTWRSIAGARGLSPHLAVAVTYMDSVFQVDALTFGFHDRTRLLTHGVTMSVGGGLGVALSDRISAGIDVFYSPLAVRRPPATSSSRDGLLNVRGLVSYRVRR